MLFASEFKLLEDSGVSQSPPRPLEPTLARKGAAEAALGRQHHCDDDARRHCGPTGPWGPAYDSTQRDRRQTRDRHAIFMIYLLDRVAVRMSRCSTQPAPLRADEPDSRRHDLAVEGRHCLERL